MFDTICAISTPPGIGGVAIIRVSGPSAKEIVSKILPQEKHSLLLPSRFFHTYILDPSSGEILEEAIISYYKAPKSFTGEDVVEISVHGGLYSPQLVLDLLIKNGARLAEPGEFTKRAFLNGKMDLIKVQALLDLLKARSEKQVRYAMAKLRGELSKKLQTIADTLFKLLKEVEARVEFEEDVPPLDNAYLIEQLKLLKSNIDKMLEEGSKNALIFEGIKVAIIGRPNVGKSSLFNYLLKMERAIVTPIPGTTRDAISEEIFLEGIPVKLYDTAGLRETSEIIENMGIKKTKEIIEEAHFAIFVIDGSEELSIEDISLWNNLKKDKIIVINKIDLGNKAKLDQLKDANNFPITKISCKTGEGFEKLERILKEKAKSYILPSSEFSLSKRESYLLMAVKQEIEEILNNFGTITLDIVSFHLLNASNRINEIFGWGDIPERVLNSIFNEFCIGK